MTRVAWMLLGAFVCGLLGPAPAHAQGLQCTTTLPISVVADTELVAGVAAKKIWVCSIVLVAATAEVINFVEGTGSVCATGKTAVVGSTTDANGMSLANNGVLTLGGGAPYPTFWTSTAGNALCLTLSGSNRVAGFITFAQQ